MLLKSTPIKTLPYLPLCSFLIDPEALGSSSMDVLPVPAVTCWLGFAAPHTIAPFLSYQTQHFHSWAIFTDLVAKERSDVKAKDST